jgi:hypothetical protein
MAEFQVIVNEDGSIVVNDVSVADVITQVEETTVVIQPDDSEVINVEQTTTVIEAEDGSVIVSDVGVQGPASEDDVAFATRVDFIGDDRILKGQAQPGTAEATLAWRIQEITFVGTDEDVVIKWSAGDSNFNKSWIDRLGATYT